MGRHRLGEGEYRYLATPLPEAIDQLRQALYPHLLRIARDWYAKLGRPTPWPDSLDDWVEMCHAVGQTRPTPLILKYGQGDWNALHRDLYGALVFPLQVVVNLSDHLHLVGIGVYGPRGPVDKALRGARLHE